MALGHLLDTFRLSLGPDRPDRPASRRPSGGLAPLAGMDTDTAPATDTATDTQTATHTAVLTAATSPEVAQPVLTLSELAARLSVSAQTLYDLRSKGRGPRGFRIGRELRFRASEVDAWLDRLEAADEARHPSRSRR
jgi:excisionase family DNA binding protein